MRKVDQTKHAERREQIMAAAIRCFERDGFRGASIADICAEAKMSPGHLYHYFDSKDAIVKAITERRLQNVSSAFAELELVSDLVDAMIRMSSRVEARGARLHAEMIAEGARNPAVGRIMADYYDTSSSMLAALLKKGQARNQVDAGIDPQITAAMLIAAKDGLRQRLVLDPDLDGKQAASMMKMLIERCLRPTISSAFGKKSRQSNRLNDEQPAALPKVGAGAAATRPTSRSMRRA